MNLKKIFYVVLISQILFISKALNQENKILFNINNEIITSIDILNEINYLSALNNEFKNTDKLQSFEIAKNSLIREKIKEIELKKFYKKLELNENQLQNFLLSYFDTNQISNIEDLKKFLIQKNLDFKMVKRKFTIELMWNRLIYLKYNKKIKIDEEEIKKKISNKKTQKEYFLSEILFNLKKGEKLNKKFNLIKRTIQNQGFSKAVLLYSESESIKNNGKLGWIKESTINKNLINKIKNVKINNFTDPIVIPGGFLILKVEEVRELNQIIDTKKEIKLIIQKKSNEQLNQFSNMHFNKIKKNIFINEL